MLSSPHSDINVLVSSSSHLLPHVPVASLTVAASGVVFVPVSNDINVDLLLIITLIPLLIINESRYVAR